MAPQTDQSLAECLLWTEILSWMPLTKKMPAPLWSSISTKRCKPFTYFITPHTPSLLITSSHHSSLPFTTPHTPSPLLTSPHHSSSQGIKACNRMHECLATLSCTFPAVKFCSLDASQALLSVNFVCSSPLSHLFHHLSIHPSIHPSVHPSIHSSSLHHPVIHYQPKHPSFIIHHLQSLSGVPAMQVYKGGELIGNFVKLRQEFGEDFCASDVESFLVE